MGTITKEQQKFWDILSLPLIQDCSNCKHHDRSNTHCDMCDGTHLRGVADCLGNSRYANWTPTPDMSDYWEWDKKDCGFNN